MTVEKHIAGRDAARMAEENDKRRPITLDPAPNGTVDLAFQPRAPVEPHAPVETNAYSRTAPPRVLKPSRGNDQVCAPTLDLEGHRAALRRVFGTLSEDYSQTMFGKLVVALRPNPHEHLDETTLNAAIALVASMEPKTELEALLAVEIAAIGFAGHKFLRQSQHHLDEVYISVYGNFSNRPLGSSTFRPSTTAVSMSLTGSRFSSESAPRPFQHGVRGRGGTIYAAALPSS